MDGLGALKKYDLGFFAYFGLALAVLIYRQGVLQPGWIGVYALYAPPWVAWILFAPFLWRARKRDTTGLLLLLAGVLILFLAEPLIVFGHTQVAPLAMPSLRLLTVNVHGDVFGGASELSSVGKNIAKLNPDLLCVQEVWSRGQLSRLKSTLPGYTFLMSKENVEAEIFPLQGCIIGFKNEWHAEKIYTLDNALTAQLRSGNMVVSLTSIHGSKGIGLSPKAMEETASLQRLQAQSIVRKTESFEGAKIVAGDFNSPVTGPGVKLLSRLFHSAFKDSGKGTGWTYPSQCPFIGIDHILGNQFVSFLRTEAVDCGSDHLGLLTYLTISNPTGKELDTKANPTPHEELDTTHRKTRD